MAQTPDSFDSLRSTSPRGTVPRVLSIAGTDPTGGAGMQADLKSIAAAEGYGMSVITAVVTQNTQGVRSVHTPGPQVLTEQLQAVIDDVAVDGVKIGMLGDLETVQVVEKFLSSHHLGPVVLDPVMVASSGDRLLDPAAEQAVRELASLADVLTPNIPELAVLAETNPATSLAAAIEQATTLAAAWDCLIVVKGGHLTGERADNALVSAEGAVHHVSSPRIDTDNTHGTGCSLSSALATRLAAGDQPEAALEWATRWLHGAIRGADALNVGRGHGPVDHHHHQRRMSRAASARPWTITPAAHPSPAQIPPAGEHTAALWEASSGVWQEIQELSFIEELAAGTLRTADFNFYLSQDAYYLEYYSKALALLAAKAPDSQSKVQWADCSVGCIEAEAALHREWIKSHDVSFPGPSPITLAYTNHLIASTAVEDYAIGAAAVLPCFWLYAEVGLKLAAANHSAHPYKGWLEMYAGPQFIEDVRLAIQRVEEALEAASQQQRERATEAYLQACVHEREFFDQAERAW